MRTQPETARLEPGRKLSTFRRLGTALLCVVALSAVHKATQAEASAGVPRASVKSQPVAKELKMNVLSSECGTPDIDKPILTQERSMLCRLNAVRLVKVTENPALDAAAQEKINEIIGCETFSHTPCIAEDPAEGPFDHLAKPADPWHVAENLAWGAGDFGSVSSIFQAWRASDEHWPNIKNEQFTEIGIAARHVPSIVLNGVKYDNTLVWATEFLGQY